ncbi:unnamed protein product [Lactuca saligna]|uniref:DUF1985 domain-containing protein n=1 Tax=Lactuca saligna TaxID=75948 RepID=A0AA35VUN0_LACSI|nr:unnamed protein product [Lactuca saligna]
MTKGFGEHPLRILYSSAELRGIECYADYMEGDYDNRFAISIPGRRTEKCLSELDSWSSCSTMFYPMDMELNLRGWPAECTFRGAFGTVLKKYFTKLNSRRVEVFRETTFRIFIGMPTPNGDPMLYHLTMLHEVRDVEVARARRFQFELKCRVVEYGETEFCLISGLRFGSYVDIINTKVSTSSTLRNRLFPNVRDEDIRLKDLEDYVKGSAFSTCSDEDEVMVVQMVFLFRGLIGRDDNMCIPSVVYELADSQYNWNRFAWGTYLWRNKIPRMRAWRIKTQLSLEQCLRILDVSVENNIPRDFEPTPVEIHLPFFVRYVSWTLDKVYSPPQQQSHPKDRSPSP